MIITRKGLSYEAQFEKQIPVPVVACVGKVGQLIEEITSASAEQSQGIEQLRIALSQIDQVTQNMAASAEETAGASGQMREQAERMTHVVQTLSELIDGLSFTFPTFSEWLISARSIGKTITNSPERPVNGSHCPNLNLFRYLPFRAVNSGIVTETMRSCLTGSWQSR